MQKKLSSYAIIPDSLYVERDADRQLARAIVDMRKPPYVLVARQMGKTNLLLNAKRRLQTADDVFCYLDLTRRLPTLNDFFEYVVERVLDANLALRAAVSEQIREIRVSSAGRLPAIAYEKCLLAILNRIAGRLVIILDEVDSLASCTFSDAIFSQIRSVYFERGNEGLKSLQRLTYVLSGVAEPRELIKDRSISPFNIGDRIVLDDFSRAEMASFADKASLALAPDVLDRLFARTAGNPRMIWDICSQLEDMILSGADPTPDSVDSIVERLYFADLPSPPIDHIRSLVVDDRDLRSAVVALHSGDYARISDIIRSRLFLAGIARSVTGEMVVEWRNSIVRQSLSPDWLSTLPDASSDALIRFDSLFAASDFAEAERVFGTEVNLSVVPLTIRHQYLLKRAHVLVGLNRFDDALGVIDAFDADVTCPYAVRMSGAFLRACIHADMGKDQKALAEFAKVASSDGDLDQRAFAKYRITGCLLRLREPHDVVRQSVDALQEAVRFVEDKRDALQARTVTEVLGNSYLSLGQLLHAQQSDAFSIEALKNAIVEGSDSIKLRSAKELLGLLTNDEERRKYLGIACRHLVAIEPGASSRLASVERQVVASLGSWASQLNMHEEYDALLSYAIRSGMVANDSINALRLEIWGGQSNPSDIKVLREIIDARTSLLDENVGLALAYIVRTQPSGTYIQLFLDRFDWAAKQRKLSEEDFEAAHSILLVGFDGRQISTAERAAEILQSVVGYSPYYELVHLWLAIYSAISFLNARRERFRTELFADFFLKNAPLPVLERGFGKAASETMLKRINAIYASAKREQLRDRPPRKIGRNAIVRVRYADGTILARKYKRVEQEIRHGDCVLLV
ncbi:AAA-like domain-containing protein [Reyranella sp.]|uniref:AAA-like domain-containing protein n=1 Tax=Reyranella sp. TaxID=1929291 RepID=UPI0040353E69